jgi:phage shock protein E
MAYRISSLESTMTQRNHALLLLWLLAALMIHAPLAGCSEDTAKVNGDVVAAAEAWKLIQEGALLVDVRSAEEFARGSIEGAINIPHTEIEALARLIGADKQRPVVFFCRSGRRVGVAQAALGALGYDSIYNATGYEALVATRPECVRC